MGNHEIPDYHARKAALIEEIRAAFDGVSREGGVSMSEAEVIDDYGSDEERAAARLSDTDSRWQDVPDEQLALNWPLHFFDSIGFRYYLPAYMIYYLRWVDDYMEMEDDAPLKFNGNNDLEYFLAAGHKKGEIEEHFLAKFEMFTPAQGRAIAHFLQLEAERVDVYLKEEAEHEASLSEDEQPNREELSIEEWEEFDRKLFTEMSVPPADLERIVDGLKRNRIETDSPDNGYRYALEKYWNRFL